jgi:nitroreductase
MTAHSKVFDVIKERASVRDYSDKAIGDEKLNIILESARLAPSATNAQPWNFYVVKNKEKIKALGKMPFGSQSVINGFIAKAPIVIIATAGPIDMFHKAMSFIVNKKWYYLDIALAMEHMVLTAWDLGIGSCWIGWFNDKVARKVVDIPKNQEIVAMITLGYAKDGYVLHPKNRKPAEEIFKVIN